MDSFFDFLWLMFVTFLFVAYLMVLFQIIGDLFRDREESGVKKAIWIICLLFFPLITALIYLIVRGKGMAERQSAAVQQAKSDTDAYIRQTAGRNPAEDIAAAKQLLDSGTITADEFAKLKAKALS